MAVASQPVDPLALILGIGLKDIKNRKIKKSTQIKKNSMENQVVIRFDLIIRYVLTF